MIPVRIESSVNGHVSLNPRLSLLKLPVNILSILIEESAGSNKGVEVIHWAWRCSQGNHE